MADEYLQRIERDIAGHLRLLRAARDDKRQSEADHHETQVNQLLADWRDLARAIRDSR